MSSGDKTGAFHALGASVDAMVFITEPTGRMLWCNDYFTRRTGYTKADFQFANPDNPFLHPDDAERVTAFLADFAASDEPTSPPLENRFIDKWGSSMRVRSVVAKVHWEGVDAFMVTATAMYTEDQAQVALRETDERYRTLVEQASEGIIRIAPDGKIHFFNRRFRELMQLDAVTLGRASFWTLVHPDDQDALRAEVTRSDGVASHPTDIRLLLPSDAFLWVAVSMRRLTEGVDAGLVVMMIRDMTETRQLRAQLEHTQKLETLGVFAGGIAHDFNNILTGVIGNLELALNDVDDAHPLFAVLADARNAATRAGSLSQSMLAYSGETSARRAALSLVEVFGDLAPLLRSVVDRRVNIDLDLADERLMVNINPVQLQQVVMNLVTNAAEASAQEMRGVKIKVGRLFVSDGAWLPAALDAGEYACVEVSDEGNGMNGDEIGRMFDPFFTTKATGRGLGLSAVLGIIRAHGGGLRVYSRPGKGTKVEVVLPLADQAAAAAAAAVPAPVGDQPRSGTVLYVDDEPFLRRIAERVLRRAGYDVLTLDNGEEALNVLRKDPRQFSAALVDFRMPDLPGDEVIRRVLRIAPDLPIACVSGDVGDGLQRVEEKLGREISALDKPFGAKELISFVDQLIADSPMR